MTNLETKLTEHFTLKEMVASQNHPDIYNVPAPAQIENLRRVCQWLEDLRRLYNERYGTPAKDEPVRVSSGYRSYKLNNKVGGARDSNHLIGCAADIVCRDCAQAVQYATLLMEVSVDRGPWDEIIIEKKFNHFWLHFAVRPPSIVNRSKVTVIEKR
jgi:hypothetical protein